HGEDDAGTFACAEEQGERDDVDVADAGKSGLGHADAHGADRHQQPFDRRELRERQHAADDCSPCLSTTSTGGCACPPFICYDAGLPSRPGGIIVSDLETSELGYGRPASHDEFAAEEPEPASRGAREGLPKGYRMRAETHYVDMLPARRERFEPAPVSVPTPVPAAVPSQNGGSAAAPPVRSRRSDRVLAQVSEEIAAIASAAALLDVEASPLA